MSSLRHKTELSDEESAPAEETFTELKEIIVKFEEEIGGESRLLDVNRIPQIIVHQIGMEPQQY